MKSLSAKIGYVIEGDAPGHFYARTGHWVKYNTPAEAFVWSDEQVVAIRDAAEKAGKWQIQPASIHPAIYDDRVGVTIITGAPVSIRNLAATPAADTSVPIGEGTIFDMSKFTARLGTNEVHAAAMSL